MQDYLRSGGQAPPIRRGTVNERISASPRLRANVFLSSHRYSSPFDQTHIALGFVLRRVVANSARVSLPDVSATARANFSLVALAASSQLTRTSWQVPASLPAFP